MVVIVEIVSAIFVWPSFISCKLVRFQSGSYDPFNVLYDLYLFSKAVHRYL